MTFKTIILFSILSLFAVLPTFGQNPEHKIVFQLTSEDPKLHKGLIKQLNNLKDGWGETVEMEVVCHGPGINFLVVGVSEYQKEIVELSAKGIHFIACENTLIEKKIDKSAIIPHLEFVKMGIGEIVIKQEKGWSYIKVGF
jgi:intracellular sulfur oxidation DsrE/DsrF family protein